VRKGERVAPALDVEALPEPAVRALDRAVEIE